MKYKKMYVQQKDETGETEQARRDSREKSRNKESFSAGYIGTPRNAFTPSLVQHILVCQPPF